MLHRMVECPAACLHYGAADERLVREIKQMETGIKKGEGSQFGSEKKRCVG